MFVTTAQLLDGLIHEDPTTAAAYKALAGVVQQVEEARWAGPDNLQHLVLGSQQQEHRGKFGEVELRIERQAGQVVLTFLAQDREDGLLMLLGEESPAEPLEILGVCAEVREAVGWVRAVMEGWDLNRMDSQSALAAVG
jgi:hypothetical protein